ncbi:MAG: guanylate kinase [Lachnospiraceae bacterium]|nr:guanylate kinase [Lachnospiraceae bacterium]
MGKIFCLMGKSSTGKDTIYRELLKKGLGLTPIVPYTTRPIRIGEVEGREYHFTDEAGYHKLLEAGKVIEARAYDTVHGIWRYFTVAEDSLDLEKQDYCLIGTVEAYVNLKKYFGDAKICPILIDIDDGERLQRALTRERKQKQPKYEELCRRFLADCQDFAEEKLAIAGIQKRFYNHKLSDCIAEIESYIEAVR